MVKRLEPPGSPDRAEGEAPPPQGAVSKCHPASLVSLSVVGDVVSQLGFCIKLLVDVITDLTFQIYFQ